MQETAEQIFEIIKDYQCDYAERKFEITVEHIIAWANQFGDDAEFVLKELLHFLPEVYISKEKAKVLLRKRLLEIQKFYGYKTMNEMVVNNYFFNIQRSYKSQRELIENSFGDELEWEELPENKMSRIKYESNGVNLFDENDWGIMNDFLLVNLPKFVNALRPAIKNLK